MFYATHRLHLPLQEPLKLYVVEVRDGVVVSCFPFDGERQSMLWIDEIYASHNPNAHSIADIKNEVAQVAQPLYLYSVGDSTADDTILLSLK